jgi:hypothetical protein
MNGPYLKLVLPIVALAMTLSIVTCTTSGPTSSVQPGGPSPSPTQISVPSPLATPSPTASPALTSAQPKPATKLIPIARPLTWTVHVVLVHDNSPFSGVVVTILDSRGVVLLGSFRLILTRVVNPPTTGCLSGTCPPPPTTYVDRYSGCCTPEFMALGMNWGGRWSVRGSVTYKGVTKSVSRSGVAH